MLLVSKRNVFFGRLQQLKGHSSNLVMSVHKIVRLYKRLRQKMGKINITETKIV